MSPPVSPSPLVEFFDRLSRHDWKYDYTEDPTVYRQGASEHASLREQSQRVPEFKALFEAYQAYVNDRTGTVVRPERPAVDAPITLPAPRVEASALGDLEEEDQARVNRAVNPAAELAQIRTRMGLNATHAMAPWLTQLGGQPAAGTANRWDFKDGHQVRLKGEAWVYLAPAGSVGGMAMLLPKATGVGLVGIVAQINAETEAQAIARIQAAPARSPAVDQPVTPEVPCSDTASEKSPVPSRPRPPFPRFGRR